MTDFTTGRISAAAGRAGGGPDAWLRAALGAAAAGLLLAGCYTMPAREDLTLLRFPPAAPLTADASRPERNRVVFDTAWAAVSAHYYDPTFHGVDWADAGRRYRSDAAAAPDDERLYSVINAMLDELRDGHTRALSPQAARERRERRWVWIGFEYAPLKESAEHVVVTYVWPGGPALEAGVRRGWILETCDGQGAQTYLGAFLRNRRLREQQVVRCVLRDEQDQLHPVDLTARAISRPAFREVRELENRFLYLRFDGFKEEDSRWLYEQMQEHRGAPAAVLDLRFNAGGDLVYLESIAGLFLPRGTPLGTFFKSGLPARALHSRRPFLTPGYRRPIIVLVSRSTASAAEIFTRVMQNERRCAVLGQPTAGEVLNGYLGDLPDGGRLSVSIRDYETPDGRRLEGVGVAPNAPINYQLDELRAGRDSGVEAALRLLRRVAPAAGT